MPGPASGQEEMEVRGGVGWLWVDNGSERLILISQHSLTEALDWAPGPLMNTLMHELLRRGTENQRQGECWGQWQTEARVHEVKAWVLSLGGIHKVQTLSGQALLGDQPEDS